MAQTSKLSTESYKGVRDFYPEDKFIQDYIFNVWRNVAESFGYLSYDASVLEPSELYKAKSGEEIVNEQTYTFKDRGERDVTLRPEMTPTVARMIAAKRRELKFPQRWYSIPNLFRYERPQRGRLREHWQLNCDIFGVQGIHAESEIIEIAWSVFKKFGLTEDQFEIRINSRKVLEEEMQRIGLTPEQSKKLQKLLDKKDKISNFDEEAEKITGKKINLNIKPDIELEKLIWNLKDKGITNIVFDPDLVRGFDYYTGIVFEIFDKSPDNSRALFGGGRYDNLLTIFCDEPLPTVGFGMGDVTMRDVLETYGLLPEYKSSTAVSILPFSLEFVEHAEKLASRLREQNINVAVDLSEKKIGDKIAKADKEKVRFVIVVGENEVKSDEYRIKDLTNNTETIAKSEHILRVINNYD
ncbi:MAG TPA: histidine--tRNA ligase [Candidatus Paceibacterota bacterium]|nr:histidine--tRNA ligase [Candidatus Paceibacterota bacterium]